MRGPPVRQEEPKEQLPAVEGVILDWGELKPGHRVVYPNQGVCRITGVEAKEIAGQKLELVRMVREEDGAAVLVPKAKVPSIGLRRVASGEQIEGVFHYLAAQYDDPELDWKVRHRDNADRLIAGGVLGVAEVVKGLHALSRIRPLPTKEREQYDNARHLLVHEVAVSLGVAPGLAEDYVDYALMPPHGVTFKLKPPPKPVELPSRPRRKVVRTDSEDLELDELGLDLELPELGAEGGEEAAVPEGEAAALPEVPGPAEAVEPALEGEEAEPIPDAELPEDAEAAEIPEEEASDEPDGAPARGARKAVAAARGEAKAGPKKPPARKSKAEKAPPRAARAEKAPVKSKPEKKVAAAKPKKAPAKGGKKR